MKLSLAPVRELSHVDLDIALPADEGSEPAAVEIGAGAEQAPTLPMLDANDEVLLKVRDLLADGYAGVILAGQPGTSKTFYARRIAASLCDGDESRVSFVQFHPSYQYEDFIETYQPTEAGGFAPKARIFLEMCDLARSSDAMHVLVIDELSRTDAVRVFGEALTYLESSQRGIEFELASGRRVSIPKNLFIVATMNPWDRGVDELDMAFERRFAKIAMEPSSVLLRTILYGNGMPADLIERIATFFDRVQGLESVHARIGHAYFSRVKDISGLRRLWDHQLSHHFRRAFRLTPKEFDSLQTAWNQVLVEPPQPAGEAA